MAGRGLIHEADTIYNDNLYMFRDNTWMLAEEPLHTDKPDLAGIGLGMSFADTLQRKFDKKIGLIPCAFGGTSLAEWKQGELLYTNAVSETIKALESSSLKGILWHQGESDADHLSTAQNYKDRFQTFIASLLVDINQTSIPIIIGELGEFLLKYENCAYSPVINNQLKSLSLDDKYYAFVSAKDLTDNGDRLHFNSKSLREFGIRYANKWMECSQRLGISLE